MIYLSIIAYGLLVALFLAIGKFSRECDEGMHDAINEAKLK